MKTSVCTFPNPVKVGQAFSLTGKKYTEAEWKANTLYPLLSDTPNRYIQT
jgi:hypothetical protein